MGSRAPAPDARCAGGWENDGTMSTESSRPSPAAEPSGAARHRGGARSIVLGLLVLALVAGLGAWWWQVREAGDPSAAASPGARVGPTPWGGAPTRMPVTVATVGRADVPVTLDALGTVESLHTVTVRSQVDGPLVRVAFREGQFVQAGALLAEIDPRPFEVQLAQAQGQLARDRALLENARRDLARYRELVRQDAASEQQRDTQAALVAQYESVLQIDQAQVDHARLQLGYTRITAPISGLLGMRLVDAGNLVRAGDATGLVTITQMAPIAVGFAVAEQEIAPILARYHAGEAMAVQALDRTASTVLAEGRLTTLDNRIDVTTGTLRMKAQFANTDRALYPNQFVNARIAIDRLADALVVPAAAVQRGSAGTWVYVVETAADGADATVRRQPVETGPGWRDSVVVRSGLADGERVVVDGVDNLRDGTSVEPVDRQEAEREGERPSTAPAARGGRTR